MEQTSIARIQQLHPKLRDEALQLYNQVCKITPAGVHPFITQTLRSFAESDALYAQGRTKRGPIVTNAPAGESYHNYGLAFDFCLQINGKVSWNVDENWMKVVKVFKDAGWAWGGDFHSIKDQPHLEKTFGHNWRELLALHNAGKVDHEGYVII